MGRSFAAPGIYDVELTVTDGKGATATDVVRVRVGPFARITNARLTEGNSGTKAAKFVVRLSRASSSTTTLRFVSDDRGLGTIVNDD